MRSGRGEWRESDWLALERFAAEWGPHWGSIAALDRERAHRGSKKWLLQSHTQLRQSSLEARRAPSAIAENFAQAISPFQTRDPTPQSVPATTLSLPTRCA